MTLRDDLLPLVDDLRGLSGELGFRSFTKVEIVVVEWAGGRPGVGAKTTTRTTLSVKSGAQPPKVRTMTQKEIIASGGDLSDEMFEIGPLTPSYGAGGTLVTDIQPDLSPGAEVFYVMVGPDGTNIWCKPFQTFTDRALGYRVRVKRTGETPDAG